jgi:hypothetical protein
MARPQDLGTWPGSSESTERQVMRRRIPQRDRSRNAVKLQHQPAIPDERLRYLARAIHSLGERPLFELFRELSLGAPLKRRLEAYARLAPLAGFISEHGGRDLPRLRVVEGGR